jgi:HSP20 family protein
MSLTTWDPFRELEEMSNRLNRFFSRSALPATTGTPEAATMNDWSPSVDIIETPEDYLVKCELSGVKKEDVKVQVNNGLLRIEGERKFDKEDKTKKYHRIERFYGAFMRSFSLPEGVDADKVPPADFKDGLLTIRLPKSHKTQRTIDVKVS